MGIKADVLDLLEKQGYRATVEDDNVNYALMITTDRAVPNELKEIIELIRPAGIAFNYRVKERTKVEVPKALHKWYRETMKETK